jgi:uncharacterized membrane protein HdeD (DUF308 family)
MEEQQSEQTMQSPEGVQQSATAAQDQQSLLLGVEIIMGLALLAALIGIILGANNYMNGPAHYPGWVLTTWFIIDLFLIILILIHAVVYTARSSAAGDSSETQGGIIAIGVFDLIGGAILLYNKHLAWISILAFLLLIAFLVADIGTITSSQDEGKPKEPDTATSTEGTRTNDGAAE